MSPASQSRALPSSIRTPREPTTPAFDIDRASDDSALDSSPPLSPDDAELLAKLEEEAMKDMDVEAEAIEAHARAEARRVRSRRERISTRSSAAPTDLVRRVYANPDSSPGVPARLGVSPRVRHGALAAVVRDVHPRVRHPEQRVARDAEAEGADRPGREEAGSRIRFGDAAQATFVIVFTVEAFVKIVASGLVRPGRVPAAVLEHARLHGGGRRFGRAGVERCGGAAHASQARADAAAAQALNKFKSGRMVLQTLGSALPMLVDVVLFMLWFVVSMAVMGTMFFGGTMTTRAYAPRSDAEVVEVEAATAAAAAGASARRRRGGVRGAHRGVAGNRCERGDEKRHGCGVDRGV